MSVDVKEIAGLSDGARTDLLNGRCIYPGHDGCLCLTRHSDELFRSSLVERDVNGDGLFLTRKGLAVRAHLLATEPTA